MAGHALPLRARTVAYLQHTARWLQRAARSALLMLALYWHQDKRGKVINRGNYRNRDTMVV